MPNDILIIPDLPIFSARNGSGAALSASSRESSMSQSTIKVTYRIETAGDVGALAAKIASDQSTGTFVEVPGETPELKARVAARVVDIRMLEPVATPSVPQAAVSTAKRAL